MLKPLASIALIGWVLAAPALADATPQTTPAPAQATAATGQITFFYYRDLPKAAAFYEKLLQVSPEQTPDWVRLFPISPTATLGLVNAEGGALRPMDEKPVMFTILVENAAAVDRWLDRVRGLGIAIKDGPKTTKLDEHRSIYAFMINDPEGYVIEILSWTPTVP